MYIFNNNLILYIPYSEHIQYSHDKKLNKSNYIYKNNIINYSIYLILITFYINIQFIFVHKVILFSTVCDHTNLN